MKNKTFIVVLFVLVLLSLNFSVAHEIDNATNGDLLDSDVLSISDVDQNVLKANSQLETQIDVKSNTTFDSLGDYFKIRLADENGVGLSNTKVKFDVSNVTYTKTTDSNGIASLQINLNDGSYNITTNFLGNSNYKASSNTTTITVKNTRIVDEGLSNSEIQKIIDNAKDGNVILFTGKSYSDVNLVINKRLTLKTNSSAVLKSSSSRPVITVKGDKASNTIINGFNIQGKGNGIVVTDSDFIRIINNAISGEGNGIVATGTTYLNITKNNINKNSKSAILIGNTTSTYIFDNTIKNNVGNGIEVAKSDKVYIHGNTITNNKKNAIVLATSVNGVNYGEGPKNVQINKNTLSKNSADGIRVYNAGDNLKIKSNYIDSNELNGISLGKVGSNVIQSNVIYRNWDNGIRFFDAYVKPESQSITYNAIYNNLHMEVEAKETYYQDTGSQLELGDNWYTDNAGICPKIKASYIKFTVTQIGPDQFQALFLDSDGNVASLLPDRTLTYTTNNGKKMSITVTGGAGVFTVDANDGDLIRAIVDNSKRDNTYDGETPSVQPINGVPPTFDYPPIPYGNGNGNGNGEGDGSGNGSGTGNTGDNNQGNRNNQNQNSENNGNSTYYQSQNAGKSSTPIDSPKTDAANSASSESASTSGGAAGAESQSVLKSITIDEDEFFRVTGMSFIVLLIMLTIGFYYRDDIKEMNSKR